MHTETTFNSTLAAMELTVAVDILRAAFDDCHRMGRPGDAPDGQFGFSCQWRKRSGRSTTFLALSFRFLVGPVLGPGQPKPGQSRGRGGQFTVFALQRVDSSFDDLSRCRIGIDHFASASFSPALEQFQLQRCSRLLQDCHQQINGPILRRHTGHDERNLSTAGHVHFGEI